MNCKMNKFESTKDTIEKMLCQERLRKYKIAALIMGMMLVALTAIYMYRCYKNPEIPSDGTLVKDLKEMKQSCDCVAKDLVETGANALHED